MKIKVVDKEYNEVLKLPKQQHVKPIHQNAFFRWLMNFLSKKELKDIHFECVDINMDKLLPDEPALYLMNHSSFTDLQIAANLLRKREFHIVMTDDGMVGKEGLMRAIGCIPTKKFIMDAVLVKDLVYTIKNLNSSILMYPEASYSFDGTKTPLPDSLGKLAKMLGVPIVMIRTKGAFLRDPLYNNLQKRNVKVFATQTLLLTKEEIVNKTSKEINEIIDKAFDYDHFKEQVEDKVIVSEPFRADSLDRVLYKCPHCGKEGRMKGAGEKITCQECNNTYELTKEGLLKNESGDTRFSYVTDWYAWQREVVREEIRNKTYFAKSKVDILMLVDTKAVYRIGEGVLQHSLDGFTLCGCNGELNYTQNVKSSYSLYADYFWYEIGDMICIGDTKARYYCFPKEGENISVAKTRIATEEMYKIV